MLRKVTNLEQIRTVFCPPKIIGTTAVTEETYAACPTLLIDSVDLIGYLVTGVGVWDDDTKITVKSIGSGTETFYTFSYPDLTLLYTRTLTSAVIPGLGTVFGNFAITNDGVVYGHASSVSSTAGAMYEFNLPANTGSIVYDFDSILGTTGQFGGSVTNVFGAVGPGLSPYDGYLYDTVGLNEGPFVRYGQIWRWSLDDLANPERLTYFGDGTSIVPAGDSPAFTSDGKLWTTVTVIIPSDESAHPLIYDIATDTYTEITDLRAQADSTVVTRDGSSVYFPAVTEPGYGVIINSDESFEPSECDVFSEAGAGTAISHMSSSGLLTAFIYSTTLAIGRLIYIAPVGTAIPRGTATVIQTVQKLWQHEG